MDRTGWKKGYILEWYLVVKWTDPLGNISCSLRRSSSLSIAKNIISAKDLTISSDVPIFATSKSRIKHPYDPIESEIMYTRWKIFEFSYQILPFQQKDLTPCPKCFCDLICWKKCEPFTCSNIFCLVQLCFDLPNLFLAETGSNGLQFYQSQYTVTDLTEAKIWHKNLWDSKFEVLFSPKMPLHLKINTHSW